MPRLFLRIAAAIVLFGLTVPSARAQVEQERLVSNAAATVERLRSDDSFAQLAPMFARAKAVLIVPSLVKAGFILGGEYGTGVLLVRRDDGSWSDPAFYTLGAGSLGLQAGIQNSEVLFTIMTDQALAALLGSAVKFGTDVGVAFLAIGGGWEASTTVNLGADIYAFSHAVGLFGGGSLEGAVVKARTTWNAAYYGNAASADDILLRRAAAHPQAKVLRDALGR